MTDRATLEALLARALEGEGPDRELDAEITRMQLPPDADAVTRSRRGWSYRVFGPDGWDDEWLENKPYTTSLDAVLRDLLPEGWHAEIGTRPDWPWARLFREAPLRVTDIVSGPTPPRALIAACLKARMEAQGE